MPALPRDDYATTEPVRFALASTDLCRWYFPARGLGYSFIFHALVFTLLAIFFPPVHIPLKGISLPEPLIKDDPGNGTMVVYLPSIGGGRRGGGRGGGNGSKTSPGTPPPPSSAGGKGLVYPGRQRIHSDSPRPTNFIQTVLQPELKNPPTLSPPLNLPNFISLPDVILPRPAVKPPELALAPPNASQPLTAPERREKDLNRKAAPRDEPAPVPPPRPIRPAIGLADIDHPETQLPLIPSPGAAIRAQRRQLEDLAARRQAFASPTLVAAEEVAISQPPKEPVDAAALFDFEEVTSPTFQIVETHVDPALAPREAVPVDPTQLVAPSDAVRPVPPTPSSVPEASLGRTVLALSPMPAVGEPPAQIPVGEARGRFAISPEPNLDTTETEPGSPGAVAGEPAPGAAGESAANASLPNTVTISFGPGSGSGSATGGGSGSGSGRGSGSASGSGSGTGTGTGSGSGSGTGPGIGSGAGSGSGTGSGAGSGPGSGPFAGITVVGGVGGPAASGAGSGSGPGKGPLAGITIGGGGGPRASADPDPDHPASRVLPAKYELFVLSTEKGGGGLPYFGVFKDEQIQTVYLDMRKTEADPSNLWTIEFAVPREESGANPAALGESQQGFLLPVPIIRELPALPPESVRKHAGRMVVVYAVVNTEGRMEQVSVKESPDPLLGRLVVEALKKWTFRTGVFNGHPTAVKTLLGIPLTAPN